MLSTFEPSVLCDALRELHDMTLQRLVVVNILVAINLGQGQGREGAHAGKHVLKGRV